MRRGYLAFAGYCDSAQVVHRNGMEGSEDFACGFESLGYRRKGGGRGRMGVYRVRWMESVKGQRLKGAKERCSFSRNLAIASLGIRTC